MNIRSLVSAALIALVALPAAAQNAVGKWNASVETPNGPFAMVFEFLVDAAGNLTGSMFNDFMGATPIKDGVIDGNDLSFKLTFEGGPNGPMTFSYTGAVNGDELALVSKFEGTPAPGVPAEATLTATRAQ
jgi:hypothetical protein